MRTRVNRLGFVMWVGLKQRWVPLASYAASNLVMWITAALCGVDYWRASDRVRWDGVQYLSIAKDGYISFRCRDRYPNWPDFWCGNTAWFPGYPTAVRVVSWLGIPLETAGVLVSEVAFLGALLLLWRLFDRQVTTQSVGVMALAAVFPGVIYFHVVFGVAMCLFGLVLLLNSVRDQRWWLAGLGAFIALSTHIVGGVGVVALAASLLFGWRRFGWWGRLWRVAAGVAVGALAYVWSMWTIHHDTGSWTIYWQHQAESFDNVGWHDPLAQIVRFYTIRFRHDSSVADHWLTAHSTNAQQAQLVLNLALFAVILGFALWRLWRRDLADWQAVAVLVMIGAMVLPLTSGAWSAWYRHDALMLVAAPVLRLPAAGWILLVGVCSIQTLFLTGMWFGGSLI